MTSRHVSDDRLIDLARDLAPPEEREKALEHVGTCAACEERFLAVCREAETLSLTGVPSLAASRPRRIRTFAAAAAVLLAVVSTGLFLLRNRDREDPDAWLPVEAERVMLRSMPESDDNAPFLAAVEAYASHDARRVVELLGERKIPKQYDFLRLLLASAYVREGRDDRALSVLRALEIETLPQPYRDRARWETYLALHRSGGEAEARTILADLASRPGEMSERARRELSRSPAAPAE